MTGQFVAGRRKIWLFAAIVAAFSVIAVACGSDDDATPTSTGANPTNTPSSATSTPANLSGTIQVDGSSTVFPITQAVAEEFRAAGNNGVQIVVGVSGTGGGFTRFATGEIDISDASRPIKESEAAEAAANGVDFFEFKVALDGLSVMVHKDNDFVDCLTTAELNKIWEPGSTVNNWNQVRSSFPDQALHLYGPGTDSGTFDYFTEEINGEAGATRADYTPSEDDNVLVQGIAGDRGSLGYFGFAYYVENADKLKIVAIDGGDGCVTPSHDTINGGTYAPLSRPLFIYVSKASLEKPEVKAFVKYYMENGALYAAEVGYVALPDDVYTANLTAIDTGVVPQPTATATAARLSGTIQVDGSSTVFPITQAVAEEFRAAGNNGVQIVVGVSGTGGGFTRFAAGEIDISDASRPIKDSEAAEAAANGVEYFELKIALDGLSVMVHKDNDWVDCLTVEELNKIWEPGSTVNNWNQIRSSFPDQALHLYGPGTDSGTFDYFTEEINGEAGATRADYTPSEDDNVLVQGIAGDRGSLGYFGYAYYVENTDKLKVLGVDGGDGCVTPSFETINGGTYAPLSRPLFIYVNKASLDKPEVKAFVEFYLENGAEYATEVGYVAMPADVYTDDLALIQ